MKIGKGRASFAVLVCVSCISCGGDAASTTLHPVKGKVTYKGEPASGAVVSFQSEGPAPLTTQGNPIVPMGVAGEDGTFSVACGELGNGAPAGKYRVLISWRPSSKSPASKLLAARRKKSSNYDPNSLLPTDPFNGRYTNPAKPLLTAEVKAGTNDLPFELKD